MQQHELIHDWHLENRAKAPIPSVQLDDETLRDGLQSPTIKQPTIEQKIELVHLMVELGIEAADIGLPGAGERATADVVAIAKEIADKRLPIAPNCAARTLPVDIAPIVEASQRSGIQIEASLFIGSSAIRQFVESWTLDHIIRTIETAIEYAHKNGLSVMLVTEDTTRAQPDALRKLYSAAIAAGARRICFADTVGAATPYATTQLIRFAREIIENSGESVQLDWHGHSDRGLGLANALAAVDAGADRLHGTAIGIGERCGNVPMELLLVNLRMLGYIDNDLSRLTDYCRLASKACDVRIANNHPVVGEDAFRTCTGVHAAAVIKAMAKGDQWLVDRVYSAVPASWVGCQQHIGIGPMSGASNVVYWLSSRGHPTDDTLVSTILEAAKKSRRAMSDEAIEEIIREVKR